MNTKDYINLFTDENDFSLNSDPLDNKEPHNYFRDTLDRHNYLKSIKLLIETTDSKLSLNYTKTFHNDYIKYEQKFTIDNRYFIVEGDYSINKQYLEISFKNLNQDQGYLLSKQYNKHAITIFSYVYNWSYDIYKEILKDNYNVRSIIFIISNLPDKSTNSRLKLYTKYLDKFLKLHTSFKRNTNKEREFFSLSNSTLYALIIDCYKNKFDKLYRSIVKSNNTL